MAAMLPNGHARQERATEAFRPEAPLRQSVLLQVLLPLRQALADFRLDGPPLRHSALPQVIW